MTGKAELVSYSDTTRSSMSARPGRSEWDSSDSDSTEPAVAAPVVNAVAVDASDAELARRFNAPDLLLDPSIVDGHNALRMAMAVGMTLPHLSQWDCPLQYTVHTGSLSITNFLNRNGWQEALDAAHERALPASHFHCSPRLYAAKKVLIPNLLAPFPSAAAASQSPVQLSNASTADPDDEPLAQRVRRKFPELDIPGSWHDSFLSQFLPHLVSFRMVPTAEIQSGMSDEFLLPMTRWLRKSEADAAALAYHGSAGAMEQARKERDKELVAERRRQKAAEAKKRKEDAIIAVRAARSETLKAALTAADADPTCFPQESYLQKVTVRAVTAYVSGITDISKKAMHDVVVRCAGAKFLHLHTTFLADCKTFRVESMNSDKHIKLIKLALEPYGGSLPAVWPWLTWTQDAHLLVSSQPFKDAVRAWLMVANRLKVPQLVAVEVVRAVLQSTSRYPKLPREGEPPRWWPLRA